MDFLRDTWHLLVRLLWATVRMPVFVLISIVQPILWVLLFGQLFRAVTTIPGFGASSYVQFLAPGISIMTALFGAAYSGMGMLVDIDRGVLDRLLATPVARGALIAGVVGGGVASRLTSGGFDDPGSESFRAAQVAAERLGRDQADVIVVYRSADASEGAVQLVRPQPCS